MLKPIKFLRQFQMNEDGNAAVELLLVIPVLVWALLSTWVYFGAYHAESVSTRAGLTIADVISRERSVNTEYLESMRHLLQELTDSDEDAQLRVTLYSYDADDDEYQVEWSEVILSESQIDTGIPDDGPSLNAEVTDADLAAVEDRLPVMANLQRSLLIETRTTYTAPFSIGLGPFLETNIEDLEFKTFTVISPRNEITVCLDPTFSNPNSGDEEC